MKTIAQFKRMIFFCVISISFIAGCGKDDEAAIDNYIPDLSAAGWINVADASDALFFFNTPPSGTASGTFSGNRSGTSESGGFTGSFNHSSITLTFNSGTNNGRVFSGSIDGTVTPTIITITSAAVGANPAITLKFKR